MEMIKGLFNIDKTDDNKILKNLFFFSLFFCLLIGVLITYNFDFSNNFNLLFESDTARVIGDMTDFDYFHVRLNVHPLFVILTQPVFHIIKGFAINKMLSLVIISSLATSISVIFIYKILSLYNNEKKMNLLVSLCYLFSFSNYIFTSGIEIFNIAALFLIILWFYVLKKVKDDNFNNTSYFILIILGALSAGFTITNFIIFVIAIFLLFIYKKISLKNSIYIILFAISLVLGLVILQYLVWHNTPRINDMDLTTEKQFIDYNISLNKINNVIKNDYYHSILGNDVYVKCYNNRSYSGMNYVITFKDNNVFNIAIVSIFYILLVLLLARNFGKNKFANTGIVLSLLFNTVLHILYGNNYTFLYSLHFLYLIFLLFGINLNCENNKQVKKIAFIYLLILLISELIINSTVFTKVVDIVKSVLLCNYFVANFGLIKPTIVAVILIFTIIVLINIIIKEMSKYKISETKDEQYKHIVTIVSLILLIMCIFINLETSVINKRILWQNINSDNPRDIYLDRDKYVVFNETSL